jgi:hypothetical protein
VRGSQRSPRLPVVDAVVSLPMYFTLTALAFALGALILFFFAFRSVFAGRIGSAVLFGVLGVLMGAAAGAAGLAA